MPPAPSPQANLHAHAPPIPPPAPPPYTTPPPDALCYARRYKDLRVITGCGHSQLRKHFDEHGQDEGRVFACKQFPPSPPLPPRPPRPPHTRGGRSSVSRRRRPNRRRLSSRSRSRAPTMWSESTCSRVGAQLLEARAASRRRGLLHPAAGSLAASLGSKTDGVLGADAGRHPRGPSASSSTSTAPSSSRTADQIGERLSRPFEVWLGNYAFGDMDGRKGAVRRGATVRTEPSPDALPYMCTVSCASSGQGR